jgi:hypothetical protein
MSISHLVSPSVGDKTLNSTFNNISANNLAIVGSFNFDGTLFTNPSQFSSVNTVLSTSSLPTNLLTRGDGGSKNIKTSGITVDDSNNILGANSLTTNQILPIGTNISITNATSSVVINPSYQLHSVGSNVFTIGTGFSSFTAPLLVGSGSRYAYTSGTASTYFRPGDILGNSIVTFGVITVSGGVCTILASSGGVSSAVYLGVGYYRINLVPLTPLAGLICIPVVSMVRTTNATTYVETIDANSFFVYSSSPTPAGIETASFQFICYRS